VWVRFTSRGASCNTQPSLSNRNAPNGEQCLNCLSQLRGPPQFKLAAVHGHWSIFAG
jgi:hypothetical protein